jgi:signal transduction histidine kinase
MPLMLFVKKWQIILYSLITIASLLFTYVSLYNSEPLILLSEETQNIHNIINIITMIVVIYLISLWFRIQGDARETELSSTLQKLESSNKTLKDFSSYLNHEIRNPLSGIIGISDLLLKKTVVTEQQKKYIQLINENGKVLLDLANEVLTSSKIDAGKVELNACTFDIYDTVENISNTYRAKAIEKNLELETIFMDGIPNKVVADQCKVRQVLINLVCNAIKFTETGKVTIKVSLHPEDNQKLLTEVSDTGVGIEQIHFDKIFLPFVQVNKDFKGFGTGLGLSISKSLAIIMDGDITVESEKEKGSCFNFSFKFDTNPN